MRIDSLDEPATSAAGSASTAIPAAPSEPAPSAPASSAPASSAPVSEASADQTTPSDPGRTRRWIGIGTGGAGVVALGVGAALGLSAISKLSDSNAGLPNFCDKASDTCGAQGRDLRSSAGSAATASTIFFTIGALAVASGIVIYLTAPHAASAIALAPAAVPGGGGALVSASF
ncbi:MAG: hypothetical protein ACREJ3_10505 [Polyangiaceae bacterium]